MNKAGESLLDDSILSTLNLKVKDKIIKFSMIGTPEVELDTMKTMEQSSMRQNQVLNDFELDFTPSTVEWINFEKHVKQTTIFFINQPRINKKLLVLDLDHTLLDFSSKEVISVDDMKRPYLDVFLSTIYPYYDIAIWSQTMWHWVEIKLTELGLLSHPQYKICFVLDKTSMFRNSQNKYVKPLQIIWSKISGQLWGKHNTVHVDDLDRNFEMNVQCGLVITPFYRETSSGSTSNRKRTAVSVSGSAAEDVELLLLSRYLLSIANSTDFRTIDHKGWRFKSENQLARSPGKKKSFPGTGL